VRGIPPVSVTAKRLLDLIPLGVVHRDTSIDYTRALICRTIDPRQKFHPAATPATHIATKGSERYSSIQLSEKKARKGDKLLTT